MIIMSLFIQKSYRLLMGTLKSLKMFDFDLH